ncbi:MAG: patatin-like phospholipase family protein [Desulfosudis oleivorans]|nr:patatin-like phospholipase family protein [Desulfosudis oleivorans]
MFASCAAEGDPPPQIKPPAKVALVLGAGASRGFTHIGALKILEANRVPIHLIVGTSAGSFVGSLSAYGFTAFQIQSLSFSIEKGDIADLTVPDKRFHQGRETGILRQPPGEQHPDRKDANPALRGGHGHPVGRGSRVRLGQHGHGGSVRAVPSRGFSSL